MENFGLGFDKNDPSTHTQDHMPVIFQWVRCSLTGVLLTRSHSGMLPQPIGHEKVVWDIRQEPKIIDAFSKIWGTSELIVSFDGGNLSLPGPMQTVKVTGQASWSSRRGLTVNQRDRWSHVDTSPLDARFQCVQGVVNLNENVWSATMLVNV